MKPGKASLVIIGFALGAISLYYVALGIVWLYNEATKTAIAGALANAPYAADALGWGIGLGFPGAVLIRLLRGNNAFTPMLGGKMYSIIVHCLAGVGILWVSDKVVVPGVAAAVETGLKDWIPAVGLLTALSYWGIWLVVVALAVMCFGIAAGFSPQSIVDSARGRIRKYR